MAEYTVKEHMTITNNNSKTAYVIQMLQQYIRNLGSPTVLHNIEIEKFELLVNDIIVSLSKDERDRYNELTDKILLHGGSLDDNLDPDPILELLLIQRARVISGCMEKVDKLIEIMKSFKAY